MARRTFFSIHFEPDHWRAWNVRNSWVVRPQDRDVRGFFDSSVFEASKGESAEALKAFLRNGLENTSFTCVLAGTNTWTRRWVRYEIARSLIKGNGLLTVFTHGVKGKDESVATKGSDPLASISVCKADGEIRLAEWSEGKWVSYADYTLAFPSRTFGSQPLPPQPSCPCRSTALVMISRRKMAAVTSMAGSRPPPGWPTDEHASAPPIDAPVRAASARPPSANGRGMPMAENPVTSPAPPRRFNPKDLQRTVLALPLIERINDDETAPQAIIIDLNLEYPGRGEARSQAISLLKRLMATEGLDHTKEALNVGKSQFTPQYLFATLRGTTIRVLARELVTKSNGGGQGSPIYKIWPDFPVKRCTNVSIATVKANAAHVAFGAGGEDIYWAVMDTGIDGHHSHFARHKNLALKPPLTHRDFTAPPSASKKDLRELALVDRDGHGTHVAGIIAGQSAEKPKATPQATVNRSDEKGGSVRKTIKIAALCGMAPNAKLLSLKVLDDEGIGEASSMIAAIGYIQEINGYGRRIRIQGANMSVGYDFNPEWFACGQSPLCVEVNRLVRSGVVVVVAAGNTGYGYVSAKGRDGAQAGLPVTINDPGNADLAITVGSTHREMPHVYGVSYFSSKGPTGDGRAKPDVIAPGERIISCASSQREDHAAGVDYREDSGTSMAAPHVSGVIAAFLSIRREFVGQPEQVKDIFLSSATDLRRAREFQGAGLVDLMRAIQSV